jgi:magnesium transporter
MKPEPISLNKTSNVSQAIDKIRASGISEGIDTVFVVDEKGKYAGCVQIRQLLTQPESISVESLTDMESVFVRLDAHRDEVRDIFCKHDITIIPVLDHEDKLLGYVSKNGEGKHE